MATGTVQLMHECSPEPLRMEAARQKQDKETEEEGNQKRVNMERSTSCKKNVLTAQV